MTAALSITLLLAPSVPADEIPPAMYWNDLAGAPPASDRYRFPPSGECEAALRFNDSFRRKMGEERQRWADGVQPIFDITIAETEALRAPWDAIAWAQWGQRADWRRRLDLKKLRELIGDEDYEAGILPPVVPSWRFRTIP